MYTDTEAVVLRQTKTLNGRRMITIFSQKYGKIGAGTSISEKGKNKSALALRPFCYGRYELFKGRETFNIQGAEVIESFYSLGEDVDKYFAASYALGAVDPEPERRHAREQAKECAYGAHPVAPRPSASEESKRGNDGHECSA